MKRVLSILLAALLLLFAVPTVAEGEALQTGLYVSDAGEVMYLNEEGVGVLICVIGDLLYCNGVIWSEDSLEIERTRVPFAAKDETLTFTYGDAVRVLRYYGASDDFGLGDMNGTAFAGTYEAEDGKRLTLTADGRGLYWDGSLETAVFWGSYLPFFEGQTDGSCYILFGSYLSNLTFAEGMAVLTTETGEGVSFAPAALEDPALEEATMMIVSPAFDLCVTLPTDRWIVEETEGGLLVSLQREMIQFTFLSLALEKEPNAPTLDAYAGLIWAKAGAAGDGEKTDRSDCAVGDAKGRRMATEWTRDGAVLKGDSVLWYTGGRLYAALSVSNEDTRTEALALLEGALATFTTAEAAADGRENLLPLGRDALESIRELPPVAEAAESVYYGYRMSSGDQSMDLIPAFTSMGLDPRGFCLILREDGTGSIQMMDDDVLDITWTEDTMTAEDETIGYTREGDHIILAYEDETVEFAPAAEIELLLSAQPTEDPVDPETVVPTTEDLTGSWTFTRAKAMGMEIPAAMMGMEMFLTLNEDGSAILLTDGDATELSWAIREDGKVSLNAADEEIFLLTFDGEALVLNAEIMKMIFEKDA